MKIGILGGGQLGLMLAEAAAKLGHTCVCYDPSPDAPARAAAQLWCDDYHDFEALHKFASAVDVVTYEFENIPLDAVTFVEQRVPVLPRPNALEVGQERLAEKQFLAACGIPVPPFAPADSQDELERVARKLGFPLVLKTRRFGYDGKGQQVLRSQDELKGAWDRIGGTPLIVEGFVSFECEVSLICARDTSGNTVFYPLVENTHKGGILRRSLAPAARASSALQELAQRYGSALLQRLDYVGVLAIEFFVVGDTLIANEIAPRVHNSGHWTIEGARTSQFENHIRAVTGEQIAAADVSHPCLMFNIIGLPPADVAAFEGAGAHVHLYGKEPRPGRKLGHITACGGKVAELEELAEKYRLGD